MISVNQGTGTSVPERVGKWGHMMFLIKGDIWMGVEIFKGGEGGGRADTMVDTMRSVTEYFWN